MSLRARCRFIPEYFTSICELTIIPSSNLSILEANTDLAQSRKGINMWRQHIRRAGIPPGSAVQSEQQLRQSEGADRPGRCIEESWHPNHLRHCRQPPLCWCPGRIRHLEQLQVSPKSENCIWFVRCLMGVRIACSSVWIGSTILSIFQVPPVLPSSPFSRCHLTTEAY